MDVQNILSFLSKSRFSSTIDRCKEYSSRSKLYYKEIGHGKVLVINHFNHKRKVELQGFDAWISHYERPSEIGEKPATAVIALGKSLNFSTIQRLPM